MGKKAVHKIIIQKGRDSGARTSKEAAREANRLRDRGKRLYPVPLEREHYEFTNTEEEEFKPGTLKRHLAAPGRIVITGDLRDK